MDAGTRKFISIIVVAVMLLTGLLTALMLLPPPEGYNEEGDGSGGNKGWEVKWDTYLVTGDAQWKGWDQPLEYPVFIEPGASLTIKDSDISVSLEDMIFWEGSVINVSQGASLRLVNTDLVVNAHLGLKDALIDTTRYSDQPPSIWRVLNLKDATDPVLEFDLEFMRGESYVVVAVQRTPSSELRPIEVLDAEEVGLGYWSNVRVPLVDYIGSTPRVSIFVHNSTAYDVLLTNIEVTDAGGPLEGDILGRGDLWDDGWAVNEFDRFVDVVERYWSPYEPRIQPLITSMGKTTITDSQVLSQPGLRRDWRGYRPQGLGKPGIDLGTTVWTSPRDGGMNVTGELKVEGSRIEYVPITVTYGSLDLLDSTLIGDCEVVTQVGGRANIEGCDLAYVYGEGIWNDGLDLRRTWLLALERDIDFTVKDCNFSGEGTFVGIHINRAAATLEGNRFFNLSLGMWVHEVNEEMRWASVDPVSTFEDSCGLYFLETHECTVVFEGPDEPSMGVTKPVRWRGQYLKEVPGLESFSMTKYVTPHYAELCVPVIVVGKDIGQHQVDLVSYTVHPDWSDSHHFSLYPEERSITVWLEDEDDDIPGTYLSSTFDAGPTSGVLAHRMATYMDLTYLVKPYLNVTMDGRLVERVYLNESEYNWSDGMEYILHDIEIPPGPHSVNVSLAASWYDFQEYIIELDSTSFGVYRITGNETWEEAHEFLVDHFYSIIMVDAGLNIDGIDFQMGDPASPDYKRYSILTWEGTYLGFDSITGEDRWMVLTVAGYGSVTVKEFQVDAYLRFSNTTVVVDNMMLYDTYLQSYSAHFEIRETISTGAMTLHLMDNSTCIIDGVDVDVLSAIEVYVEGSNLTMRDVSFQTDDDARFFLGSIFEGVIIVESCEFTGIPVTARFADMNATFTFEDCTFLGKRAFLAVEAGYYTVDEETDPMNYLPHNGSISGNSFEGKDSGLLFDVGLRETILGVNHLSDGARAYARYRPEVVISGAGVYGYNISTLDCYEFYKLGRLAYSNMDEAYNYLVDVTADLLDGSDPGYVPVVVWVKWSPYYGSQGTVVGFLDVPISSAQILVRGVNWERIDHAIERLLEDFVIENNWWNG
jgi:hypothetical protein